MNTNVTTPRYVANVRSVQDYYPFGMHMPGRSFVSGVGHRYGFNGQEKEEEVHKGSYSAEFWQYDSRIGRRWNIDPKPNPSISPLATFANCPIFYADHRGDTLILDNATIGKNNKYSKASHYPDANDILSVISEGIALQDGQENAFYFDKNKTLQVNKEKMSNYTTDQQAVAEDFIAAIDGTKVILRVANRDDVLPTGKTLGDHGGAALIGNAVYLARTADDIPPNTDPIRFIYGPDSSNPLKFPRPVVLTHELAHHRFGHIRDRDVHMYMVIKQEDRMRKLLGLDTRQTHNNRKWREHWKK